MKIDPRDPANSPILLKIASDKMAGMLASEGPDYNYLNDLSSAASDALKPPKPSSPSTTGDMKMSDIPISSRTSEQLVRTIAVGLHIRFVTWDGYGLTLPDEDSFKRFAPHQKDQKGSADRERVMLAMYGYRFAIMRLPDGRVGCEVIAPDDTFYKSAIAKDLGRAFCEAAAMLIEAQEDNKTTDKIEPVSDHQLGRYLLDVGEVYHHSAVLGIIARLDKLQERYDDLLDTSLRMEGDARTDAGELISFVESTTCRCSIRAQYVCARCTLLAKHRGTT